MMNKIIPPDAYDFDDAQAGIVKFSSRGLQGDDLKTLIKRASAGFADEIRRIQPYPGEELVHLIALGSTEFYGANRNGDGFRAQTCRDYHPTFVKHARWYRNHENNDPAKSYGIVKASCFNEALSRIELIVALNATKDAAEKNGGLIADKELSKLHSGQDVRVSMSTRVPYDVCVGCGNQSRTRDEYCGPEICKYGGCRDNLTQVFEDGLQLHVDNPIVCWRDISDVDDSRNADRTAWTTGLYKAASTLPAADLLKSRSRLYKLAYADPMGGPPDRDLRMWLQSQRIHGQEALVAPLLKGAYARLLANEDCDQYLTLAGLSKSAATSSPQDLALLFTARELIFGSIA